MLINQPFKKGSVWLHCGITNIHLLENETVQLMGAGVFYLVKKNPVSISYIDSKVLCVKFGVFWKPLNDFGRNKGSDNEDTSEQFK